MNMNEANSCLITWFAAFLCFWAVVQLPDPIFATVPSSLSSVQIFILFFTGQCFPPGCHPDTVKCGEQIPFPFPVLKKLKTCLPVMIPQIICKYYHHMTCDVFGFSMCWVEARKRGSSTSSCCSKNDYRCLQQNKVLLHPREPWIWKRFLLAKKYESIHLTKHSSSSTNLTNLIQQIYAWSPSSNHQPSLNSLLISQVLLSSWRS